MLKIILFASISIFSLNLQAQVLATIDSKKITVKQFLKKYNQVKSQTINPPTPAVFLEDLVRFEIGVLEAEKKGFKNSPIVKEKFRQELYKAFVEKSIGQIVQGIKVNKSEMKRFYKKNPELRTKHILIEYKPEAKPAEINAAKKRALEIYAEVRNSKRPFAELAKLYSDDPLSKQNGGDIGWQSKISLVPTYYQAAVKLKQNKMYKGIVRTRYGFHIIKLTGIRSYANADKKQIRTAVFNDKRNIIFNRLFMNLKTKYRIKVNKSRLKSIN